MSKLIIIAGESTGLPRRTYLRRDENSLAFRRNALRDTIMCMGVTKLASIP